MPAGSVAKSGQPLRALGRAVRAAREELGLIREVVAEASGISVRTVRRLEDGQGCGLDQLCAVAPVVGLTVELRAPRWHDRVVAAVLRYTGPDWLLSRPS